MKKIVVLIIFCAAFSLSLYSCSDKVIDISTDDGAVLAANDLLNFYFYYPSDWILDKNEAMISIYKDEGEVFQTNMESKGESYAIIGKTNISAIAFRVLSTVESTEDYWNDYCLPQMEMLDNFTLASVTDAVMGEFDAKRYDFTAEIGGVPFQYVQVFALDRGVIYTVTYTASSEKFGEYSEVLEKVVSTFALK